MYLNINNIAALPAGIMTHCSIHFHSSFLPSASLKVMETNMDFPKKKHLAVEFQEWISGQENIVKCKEITGILFLNTMFKEEEKKKHIVNLMFHNMLFLLYLKEGNYVYVAAIFMFMTENSAAFVE